MSNNQNGADRIEERLERFVANSRWLELFDSWHVDHIYMIGSDHAALKLQVIGSSSGKLFLKNLGHRFYFEQQRVEKEGCRETIEENWGVDYLNSGSRCHEKLIIEVIWLLKTVGNHR